MLARGEAKEVAGSVDFGILTVREDELEAMARRCRRSAVGEYLVRGRQDYLLFDVALGAGRDLIYRLVLVKSVRQGAGEAQLRVSNLIVDFDPNWLMLAGIAGASASSEFTLGDVVVAPELTDLQSLAISYR